MWSSYHVAPSTYVKVKTAACANCTAFPMDINRSHMKVLHAIVQSGNATMECVSDNFAAHFQTHGERFQARCLYASLLRQNVLEDVLERITAIYILRYGYTCQMSSFPFLHVFLQLVEVARGSGNRTPDAFFLQALLANAADKYKDSTPVSIAAAFSIDDQHETIVLPDVVPIPNDPPYIPAALHSAVPVSVVKVRQAESASTSIGESRRTIQHGHHASGCAHDQSQNGDEQVDVSDNSTQQHLVDYRERDLQAPLATVHTEQHVESLQLHGFAPCFPRPLPPLTAPNAFETSAIQPSISNSLMWDDSGEVAPACLAQMQQLLLDAQSKPLQPVQHKEFLLALESWPRLVHHIGFCPTQLPALVEHNNMIAVDLLLKLIETYSPRVTAFLDVLVHMDLSVHSMEVVKTLTSAASLPEEFIHRYINSCIAACEAIEQRTPKQQNRPVRLVCVFLQSLIRTKIVDVRAIQYEVLSFCVKFSRIREAASLFRLLQNLNDSSAPSTSPVNPN